MHWKALIAAPLFVALLAGCSTGGPTVVHFETSEGNFTIELYEDAAPITTANFLEYVDSGFYDNTLFHRIVASFVIQGGGKDAESGEFKQTEAPIKNEAISSGLLNLEYTLSMARTQQADSATSQFFINLKHNTNLDPVAGPGYAVFGIIKDGRDVIDAIAGVETKAYDGGPFCQGDNSPSCPVDKIVVHKAWRENAPEPEEVVPVGPPQLSLGTVQQDAWQVNAMVDHLLVYVTNAGGASPELNWSIEHADGSPLPEGWEFMIDAPSTAVGEVGVRGSDRGRTTYPDTQYALITLTAATPVTGEHPMTLSLGETDLPITITGGAGDRVSTVGDSVEVTYRGYFDDGEEFDSGSFPTVLGSGQTVTGFDLGLIGLANGEEVTLQIPAAMAYGYDNTGRLEQFNGKTLFFDVSLEVDAS